MLNTEVPVTATAVAVPALVSLSHGLVVTPLQITAAPALHPHMQMSSSPAT